MALVPINNKYPDQAGYTVLDTERNILRTMSDGILQDMTNSTPEGWVNVKDYGAIGDGIHDDTQALNNALNDLANGGILYFPNSKYYKITGILDLSISQNSTVKIIGNNSTIDLQADIDYYTRGIMTIYGPNRGTKIIIENLNMKATGVPPDWTSVHPHGGRGAFRLVADFIDVHDCYFEDLFFSAAIWAEYGKNILITNCSGIRVGGRSYGSDYDARGDAIYLGYLGENSPATVSINNCHFEGYPIIEDTTTDNSSHPGRCGVTIEYSDSDYDKFITISNSYFYNYQRAIHVENAKNIFLEVNNSKFDNCQMFLIYDSNPRPVMKKMVFNDSEIVINKDISIYYPQFFRRYPNNYGEEIILNNCILNLQNITGLRTLVMQIDLTLNNCEVNIDMDLNIDKTTFKALHSNLTFSKLYKAIFTTTIFENNILNSNAPTIQFVDFSNSTIKLHNNTIKNNVKLDFLNSENIILTNNSFETTVPETLFNNMVLNNSGVIYQKDNISISGSTVNELT